MRSEDDGDSNIKIVPSPWREINRDYRIKQDSNAAEDRRPEP